MKEKQFNEITEWQKEVFPEATPESKIHHLKEEVNELLSDIRTNNPNRRLEYADCIFLLFGCAAADGFNYEDICNAIDEKFKINKKRKWGKPDENGVVKHLTSNN
jgi:NTP pyrophosphatase (non-canonical NTP hydrolase)